MHKLILKPVLLLCTFGIIAGCSNQSDFEARMEAADEAKEQRVERILEKEQAQREVEMDVVPEWYLTPPDADGTGFYGVGYAKSKNMGHAVKSAKLQAEFSLAKMYKQELSGSERAFERGDTDGNVTSQTTFLIDKIVDAVPVVGYSVVEQKMVPVNGVFETFVLLKLPYDEFNKVLASQREKTLDKTVQASFDDLERRLADRRKEKLDAEEATHKREMESLQKRADIIQQNKGPDDRIQGDVNTESNSNASTVSGNPLVEVFKSRGD